MVVWDPTVIRLVISVSGGAKMEAGWIECGMFWATVGLVATSFFTMMISYFLMRSQVDPYVIVYSKHDDKRPTLFLIVIENIGAGVAYDVKFQLSRSIPSKAFRMESKGDATSFDTMISGPLISGIPLLAPGEKRVVTWGQYGGLRDALGESSVQVTSCFQSRHRFLWRKKVHSVESLLEVYSFAETDASKSSESRQLQELERMAKHLERLQLSSCQIASIASRLEKLAANNVGKKLRDHGDKLED